jgi:CBS domain-containing protein
MKINGTVSSLLQNKPAHIYSVTPESCVYDAIQFMAQKNIGAVLVISDEHLVGIMTERDYTRKVALRGKSSKETPVRDIISPKLLAVTPDESIEDCMKLMTENRVRHLPVLEGDKVVGIISIGDLVNWTISAQSATIEQMEQYISGGYLA